MSVTLFKKVDYSLAKLIHDIEFGEIGLPDIQRPFVWTPTKVRDLFDSMYKGFPVGYLLFWANDHFNGSRQIGASEKQAKIPHLLIVDGQQRLTSLYAVLRGQPVLTRDYRNIRIGIAFRPRDAQFEVSDAAIQRDPEYIPDISRVWTEAKASFKAIKEFLEKLRKVREVTSEEEDRIGSAIDRLFDLQNYPFTALEISSTVDEEQVADIFVRINSKGVQLRQADFILTLLSVFWDSGRAALEQFSRQARQPSNGSTPSPHNYFIQPEPDQLLRTAIAVGFKRARLEHVYSILRGKDLDTGQFSDKRREDQFVILQEAQANTLNLQNWHDFLKVPVRAGYRSASMISSETSLMYAYAMYLIGRHDFGVDHYSLRSIMARWFFMTSLTGRYTGSPESAMDQDLARLRNLNSAEDFLGTLQQLIDAALPNDYWEVIMPSSLETSAARSPFVLAYYAALNLLEARVLFSQMKVSELLDPVTKAYKSSIERHHLFPKGFLKRLGYEDVRETNQAANYALVEWADNLDISDRSPAEYFPVYSKRFGDQELQDMMWWHALPPGWHEMSYEDFLMERRCLMAQVTRAGFERLRIPG